MRPAEMKDEALMDRLRSIGELEGHRGGVFQQEMIEEIISRYWKYRRGPEVERPLGERNL